MKRISAELNEKEFAKLKKIQTEKGISTVSKTIRMLITSQKITARISPDVLFLASIIYTIVARLQILLAGSYTRREVTVWMVQLVKMAESVDEVIKKYKKH